MYGRGAKRVTLTGDKSVPVWICSRHRSGAIQMNYFRSTYHDARSTESWDFEQKRTSKSVENTDQKRGPRTSLTTLFFLDPEKPLCQNTSAPQHVSTAHIPFAIVRINHQISERRRRRRRTEIQINASNNKALRAIRESLTKSRIC